MPNWDKINKCGVWKVLGVIECDNCPSEVKCWGKETVLPEPQNDKGLEILKQVLEEQAK